MEKLNKQCSTCRQWLEANTNNFYPSNVPGTKPGMLSWFRAICIPCYKRRRLQKYYTNWETNKAVRREQASQNNHYKRAIRRREIG